MCGLVGGPRMRGLGKCFDCHRAWCVNIMIAVMAGQLGWSTPDRLDWYLQQCYTCCTPSTPTWMTAVASSQTFQNR